MRKNTDRGLMSPNSITADPALLDMMSQVLAQADSMPRKMRETIAAELGLDLETIIAEVAVIDPDVAAAQAAHADALVQIWDILDEAFPNEPHLWNAGESLLTFRLRRGDLRAQDAHDGLGGRLLRRLVAGRAPGQAHRRRPAVQGSRAAHPRRPAPRLRPSRRLSTPPASSPRSRPRVGRDRASVTAARPAS